ncbi:MAG: hypothetical protein AABY83_10670 [Pseudomonadota bacterium]
MRQYILWIICACGSVGVVNAAGSSTTISVVQRYEALSLPTDGRAWVLAGGEANNVPTVEYVLQGQSLNAWTSLVTIQYAAGTFDDAQINQILRATHAELERDCTSLKWSDGLATPESVQYEWRHYGCRGYPAQHELVKIIRGRHGLFVMHYVEKALQLNPEMRNRWLMAFDKAEIIEFK